MSVDPLSILGTCLDIYDRVSEVLTQLDANQHDAERLQGRLEGSIKPRMQDWHRCLVQPLISDTNTPCDEIRRLRELENWLQKVEGSLKQGETGIAEVQFHAVTISLTSWKGLGGLVQEAAWNKRSM